MHRFKRAVVYVLVAAQLLLAVPAMASLQVGGSSAHEMPCDEMPMPAGDDSCPCCPDGADSMTDCLASCLLAALAAPATIAAQTGSAPSAVVVDPPLATNHFPEPPLNPPPIS